MKTCSKIDLIFDPTGRPIYIGFSWLLCWIFHCLHPCYSWVDWNILGLRIGKLLGRRGIYVKQKAFDLLEDVLGINYSSFIRHNFNLHHSEPHSSHLQWHTISSQCLWLVWLFNFYLLHKKKCPKNCQLRNLLVRMVVSITILLLYYYSNTLLFIVTISSVRMATSYTQQKICFIQTFFLD